MGGGAQGARDAQPPERRSRPSPARRRRTCPRAVPPPRASPPSLRRPPRRAGNAHHVHLSNLGDVVATGGRPLPHRPRDWYATHPPDELGRGPIRASEGSRNVGNSIDPVGGRGPGPRRREAGKAPRPRSPAPLRSGRTLPDGRQVLTRAGPGYPRRIPAPVTEVAFASELLGGGTAASARAGRRGAWGGLRRRCALEGWMMLTNSHAGTAGQTVYAPDSGPGPAHRTGGCDQSYEVLRVTFSASASRTPS